MTFANHRPNELTVDALELRDTLARIERDGGMFGVLRQCRAAMPFGVCASNGPPDRRQGLRTQLPQYSAPPQWLLFEQTRIYNFVIVLVHEFVRVRKVIRVNHSNIRRWKPKGTVDLINR